jgi:hypothetical protein
MQSSSFSHINQSNTVTILAYTYPADFVPLSYVGFIRVIWGQRWLNASIDTANGHQHSRQQLEKYRKVKIIAFY